MPGNRGEASISRMFESTDGPAMPRSLLRAAQSRSYGGAHRHLALGLSSLDRHRCEAALRSGWILSYAQVNPGMSRISIVRGTAEAGLVCINPQFERFWIMFRLESGLR